MVKHRQVRRTKERAYFYRGKEEVRRSCFEERFIGGEESPGCVGFSLAECADFSLAGMLLGKEKNLLSSCWCSKLGFFLLKSVKRLLMVPA